MEKIMSINSANLFDENWERYDDWFEKHKNAYFSESYQSLLHPLAFPEMQEEPVTGFDKGGFIAIVGMTE